MSLLLDTHAFLWFVYGHSNLSEGARYAIESELGTVGLSIGSVWEIAIKASLGKLQVSGPLELALTEVLNRSRITLQPITVGQLERVSTMPFPDKRHRDPFDRLIVAQALDLEWKLVSRDASLGTYGVEIVW